MVGELLYSWLETTKDIGSKLNLILLLSEYIAGLVIRLPVEPFLEETIVKTVALLHFPGLPQYAYIILVNAL